MEQHNKNILDRRRKNICENYLLDTIVFLAVDGWLQVQGRKWRENDGSIIQHVPQSRNCPNNLTSDNFSFEWDSFSNTPEDNLIDPPLSAALKHLIEDQMKSISSRRTRIYICTNLFSCSIHPGYSWCWWSVSWTWERSPGVVGESLEGRWLIDEPRSLSRVQTRQIWRWMNVSYLFRCRFMTFYFWTLVISNLR